MSLRLTLKLTLPAHHTNAAYLTVTTVPRLFVKDAPAVYVNKNLPTHVCCIFCLKPKTRTINLLQHAVADSKGEWGRPPPIVNFFSKSHFPYNRHKVYMRYFKHKFKKILLRS